MIEQNKEKIFYETSILFTEEEKKKLKNIDIINPEEFMLEDAAMDSQGNIYYRDKEREFADIVTRRNYYVTKSKEIISRAIIDLDVDSQKVWHYLLTLVKPTDKKRSFYQFDLYEALETLGLDKYSGSNMDHLKFVLKNLRDTSFLMKNVDGYPETVGWLDKVIFIPGSKRKARVRFDETLEEHIMGLTKAGNYLQTVFKFALPMTSKYTLPLYELLKTYTFVGHHEFTVDYLIEKMRAEAYSSNFKDFRINALEKAVKEINLYTDIEVSWETCKKKGKKIISVVFKITDRSALDKAILDAQLDELLSKQKSKNNVIE